jgi:hypothetical protein
VPEREPFQYLVLRVVPDVQRGERINAGVVVYCRTMRFLQARVELDSGRLAALWPEVDVPALEAHLAALVRSTAGEPGAGPIAALPPSERFHWLAAPASTIVQPSEVHTGLTDDPEATLGHLFDTLVAVR